MVKPGPESRRSEQGFRVFEFLETYPPGLKWTELYRRMRQVKGSHKDGIVRSRSTFTALMKHLGDAGYVKLHDETQRYHLTPKGQNESRKRRARRGFERMIEVEPNPMEELRLILSELSEEKQARAMDLLAPLLYMSGEGAKMWETETKDSLKKLRRGRPS